MLIIFSSDSDPVYPAISPLSGDVMLTTPRSSTTPAATTPTTAAAANSSKGRPRSLALSTPGSSSSSGPKLVSLEEARQRALNQSNNLENQVLYRTAQLNFCGSSF